MKLKINQQNGFTLVEIAIVTLVGSFILLTALRAYSSYLEQQAIEQTKMNIERIESGIGQFFQREGRYPCPADPTLDPTNINYGLEPIECVNGTFDIATSLSWLDNNQPVISNRDANANGNPNDDFILFGSIPFRSIEPCIDDRTFPCNEVSLEEAYTYDEWGSKIIYVVSQHLTNSSSFNNNSGGISIEDEHKQSVITPADSAHYALISHGPNRFGAFNEQGSQIEEDCTPSSFVPTPGNPAPPVVPVTPFWNEVENCDHDDSIILKGLLNTEPDEYNDDIVTFNTSSLQSLWRITAINQMINNNDGNVGIGDFDAGNGPEADLHVRGDVQVLSLFSDRICNRDGTNCFVPEFLGGPPRATPTNAVPSPNDPYDFQNVCTDSNQAVNAIRNNRVECIDVFPSVILPARCPVGQVVSGFSNADQGGGQGNLICSNVLAIP